MSRKSAAPAIGTRPAIATRPANIRAATTRLPVKPFDAIEIAAAVPAPLPPAREWTDVEATALYQVLVDEGLEVDAYVKVLSRRLASGMCPGQDVEGATFRMAYGTQAFVALERICHQGSGPGTVAPLHRKDKEVLRANPGFEEWVNAMRAAIVFFKKNRKKIVEEIAALSALGQGLPRAIPPKPISLDLVKSVCGLLASNLDMRDPVQADFVELVTRTARMRCTETPYAVRISDAGRVANMNEGFLESLTTRRGAEPPFRRYETAENGEEPRSSERIKRRDRDEDDSRPARRQREFFDSLRI